MTEEKRLASDANTESASSAAYQQMQCGMMRLSQELRDKIYTDVFCSTAFRGDRYMDPDHVIDHRLPVSSITSLALLRTCRRVRDEIGNTWIRQSCFSFKDPESLLDRLAGIPIAVRCQIRHMRLTDDLMVVVKSEGDVGERQLIYRTAQVLKLLPGLKLDTLTVYGMISPEDSHATLDMLVRYSDGWKELRYISSTTAILGFKFEPIAGSSNHLSRQPQPSDWQNALEQRDGQASRPSVLVYRATDTSPTDIIPLDPWNPQHDLKALKVFSQAFAAGQDAETFGQVMDPTLMRHEEIQKYILVVVQRGADVDYAEKEGSPYISVGDMADIREDWEGKTWIDIKAEHDARPNRNRHYDNDGNFVTLSDVDNVLMELWHSGNQLLASYGYDP
ncbi:hypothetical protein Q7P36_008961 [Cladosporium allicinum]